ncbi:hypothetical protein Hanom_Chr09g00829891 [Helianthus anomalus]
MLGLVRSYLVHKLLLYFLLYTKCWCNLFGLLILDIVKYSSNHVFGSTKFAM